MPITLTDTQITALRATLDTLIEASDLLGHRANDPVDLVWTYSAKRDRELAALCASAVAYGRVSLVKDAGERIMRALGPSPVDTLLRLSVQQLYDLYDGYVYRMTRQEDVVDLLWGARALFETHGSLDEAYASTKQGADDTSHVACASRFVQMIRAGRHRDQVVRGFKYLLPDPADGSTSKRLHLFFRWVGRGPDGIDLGLWDHLSPEDLLMPLDTHTSRLCRYIGLLTRKTLDQKAVIEVSENLKLLDPDDPLRYDFPICHLGISGGCIHTRSELHCPQCPLNELCQLS